jgi:hypothetical protein
MVFQHPEIVDADDVGMVEFRHQGRFRQEFVRREDAFGSGEGRDLEGHDTIDGLLQRLENARCAAGPDLAHEVELAQGLTGLKRL